MKYLTLIYTPKRIHMHNTEFECISNVTDSIPEDWIFSVFNMKLMGQSFALVYERSSNDYIINDIVAHYIVQNIKINEENYSLKIIKLL